jgi:hypothetical protein
MPSAESDRRARKPALVILLVGAVLREELALDNPRLGRLVEFRDTRLPRSPSAREAAPALPLPRVEGYQAGMTHSRHMVRGAAQPVVLE